jgi:hypothetical protein
MVSISIVQFYFIIQENLLLSLIFIKMMQEFQITCVRRDPNDITTHVGIGFSRTEFLVSEIITNIHNNTALYYTYENNRLALVHARQRSDTGRWFLTTASDDHAPNNLDEMMVCPD